MPLHYTEWDESAEAEGRSASIRLWFPRPLLVKLDERAAAAHGLSRNEYIRFLCATHPEMAGG